MLELERYRKRTSQLEALQSSYQLTYAELLDERELYRSILDASPN